MASEATKDRLVLLGIIVRSHGVRGEVCVRLDDLSLAKEFELQDDVLLEVKKGEHKLCNIKSARVTAKGAILLLEGVLDRDGAELLRNTKLYQHRSKLKTVGEGEFLTGDLVGLKAMSPDGKCLGVVLAVEGAGEVPNLEIGDEKTGSSRGFVRLQVPFADTFISEIKPDEGVVVLIPPQEFDGLEGEEFKRDQSERS